MTDPTPEAQARPRRQPRLDMAMLDAANAAAGRGDLDQALQLLSAYRQLHPAAADGHIEASRILREAGRHDEAEAICSAATLEDGPEALRLMTEHARVAHASGNEAEALRRWMALDHAFPAAPAGSLGAGRFLLKLQRFDEAEAVIGAARLRLPDDPDLLRLSARLAGARRDWPLSLQRWEAAIAKYPKDQAALKGRDEAIMRARLQSARDAADHNEADGDEAEGDAAPHSLVDVGVATDAAARALLMQFESLGQNCEFGLVQRRFGAEPLGLLRWTFVRPLVLAKLLEARGAGIGDDDKVELQRTKWGEYFVADRVFGISFHTFRKADVIDTGDFLKKQAARLRWLRDKLLEDLAEGEKVFVYKKRGPSPAPIIERIGRAIRSYGNAKFLCVDLARPRMPAGTVRDAGDGLFHGYLSVLNPQENEKWDIPFKEWLAICRTLRPQSDSPQPNEA